MEGRGQMYENWLILIDDQPLNWKDKINLTAEGEEQQGGCEEGPSCKGPQPLIMQVTLKI